MILGKIIKEYRTEHNLSLRDFAQRCGLSHTYIAALEKNIDPRTGKPIAPTLDTVKFLSKGMNISIEEILKLLDDEQEFKINETAPKYNKMIAPLPHYMEYLDYLKSRGLNEKDISDVNDFIEFVLSKKDKKG